jgi:hypothetical protein
VGGNRKITESFTNLGHTGFWITDVSFGIKCIKNNMSELSEHLKKLKWLAKWHSEEVEAMKADGHLDDDFGLAIQLVAAETAQDVAVRTLEGKNEAGQNTQDKSGSV